MHPCERTRRVVAGRGITAPEPELATGGGHDLVGHQTQQRDARGRGEPAFELPPHPRDERRGSERAVVTPAACEPLPVLGLRFDDDTGARQPELVEPAEQPVGEALRRERGFVDTFRGRIELDRLDQLRWECRGNRPRAGLAAGEPVCLHTRDPEPAEHRRLGELGERAQRAQPESGEEIGELGAAGDVRREHTHRPRREEGGRLPARHDERVCRARREPGREVAVGDPDARVRHSGVAHHLEDPLRQRVVTAEVAGGAARGKRATPRAIEHDLRHELFDRAHHVLELARVRRIVGVDDGELRAPRFGFTPPEPSCHSFPTGFDRHGLHHRTAIT